MTRCILALSMLTAGCAHADRPQPATAPIAHTRPVLIVLSAATTQTLADGTTRHTGFFLNEFFEVKQGLDEAGVPYVLATVDGVRPSLDPESRDEKYWEEAPALRAEAIAWFERDPEVSTPMALADAARDPSAFSGIVVPGGQGVMTDLLDEPDLHELLLALGEAERPVGLVCHAPAVLSRLPAERSPFGGRRVTSVSGVEEVYIERVVMGAKATDRKIGRQLRRAGLRHRAAWPGSSNAVRDGNLVTSQNPFSGHEFVTLYLSALREAP